MRTASDANIKEKIMKDLKEGDLVVIALKEDAIMSPGIHHAIVLDSSGRNRVPGKSCTGYVGYINNDSISLRETWNMPYNDAGLDVFFSTIESYKKEN